MDTIITSSWEAKMYNIPASSPPPPPPNLASEPPPTVPLTTIIPPASLPTLNDYGGSLEAQFQTQLAAGSPTNVRRINVSGSPSDLNQGFTELSLNSPSSSHLRSRQEGFVMFSSGALLDDKTVAKDCGLPSGFLFTPVGSPSEKNKEQEDASSFSSSIESLSRSPARCLNCGSYCTEWSKVTSEGWHCVFCNNPSSKPAEEDRYEYSIPSHPVEYIEAQTSSSIASLISANDDVESLPRNYVFLLDANIPHEEFQSVTRAVEATLSSLSSSYSPSLSYPKVSIITFSNLVTIYELGANHSSIVSSEVYPANRCPTKEEILDLRLRRHQFVSSVENCFDNAKQILTVLSSSAPLTLRGPLKGNQQRGLGAAVQFAIALLSDKKGENGNQDEQGGSSQRPSATNASASMGHIIVCTNGAPSFGPGAVSEDIQLEEREYQREQAIKFYYQLGVKSHRRNITIDLFCGGLKTFNSRILQNLVLPNGGLLTLFREFEAAQLATNFVSSASRWCGADGVFEIRTSAPIAVTHVIGPALFSSTQNTEGLGGYSVLKCEMSGVQPNNCYTVYFELVEDILSDYAYFQFIISYTNFHNQKVLRVYTHRLLATGEKEKFIRSVDRDVTSILIAKRTVLTARKAEERDEPIVMIDQAITDLITRCGTKDPKTRPYIPLPPNLEPIPYRLFILRQGPLLGPILQHPDDIDFIRCLFLNSGLEDSIRMMQPTLLLAQPNGNFKELPLEDLALQSNFVLYLDHHTEIFIWSGRNTSKREEYDRLRLSCVELAMKTSKSRFPQPTVMQFFEGSSAARWLQCRLIPSHKDTREDQLRSFPQLSELSEDEKKMLLAKFHATDDLSFQQFYRQANYFSKMP